MPLVIAFDPRDLPEHFDDHGSDFGATSEADYEQLAVRFLMAPLTGRAAACRACSDCNCVVSGSVHQCSTSDGNFIRYDTATNTLGIVSARGKIRTFYKPDPAFHRTVPNIKFYHGKCEQ